MNISFYFLRRMTTINTSIIIWRHPFKIITTKTFLYLSDKTTMNRDSQCALVLSIDISERKEELVAHAKALVEQHDLNLLTDYYKHPIDLYSLMELLTEQLRGREPEI